MSVFCVCTNSKYLSPTLELYIGLGTQAVIFLQIFYLGSAIFRTVQSIFNQSSSRSLAYYSINWIYWAIFYLLQWAIDWKRPFGGENTISCLQCEKRDTLVWESINVYAFPDIYSITGLSYGALDILYTWKEARSIQWKHAAGLVLLLFWYFYSEYANQRMYLEQILANLGAILLLVILCHQTVEIMYRTAPELFAPWVYIKRQFPNSKRFKMAKVD